MITCNRCGAQNASGTQNCAVCGASLSYGQPVQGQPGLQQPSYGYSSTSGHQQQQTTFPQRPPPGYPPQQQQQYHQHQPQQGWSQQAPTYGATGAGAPPPPFIANVFTMEPGEQYVRCWRALNMPTPDAQGPYGMLVATNYRVLFLEEQRGGQTPYSARYSVHYRDISGISVSGFMTKQMVINGFTDQRPWSMIFTDVYDVDQASFQVTSAVSLSWLQGYLLEQKGKSMRLG